MHTLAAWPLAGMQGANSLRTKQLFACTFRCAVELRFMVPTATPGNQGSCTVVSN